MPYVERVTKAGNTIEIERYFTSRYKKKGISRGDKVKPTKEEQEKVNTRQAERKLRILINANYGYGDYHLVLDYIRRKGEPDRTPEQMRQDIDVFLRECRKEYRKAGLEFKYIHVMEIGKGSAGEYTPEIREHRRAGRQLFTRRTGTAYSIGESKRGIPYNRRTQT